MDYSFIVLFIMLLLDIILIFKHDDKSDGSLLLRIIFGLFTILFTMMSIPDLPFTPYFATMMVFVGLITISSIWFKGKR